jgi:hypothetical protein
MKNKVKIKATGKVEIIKKGGVKDESKQDNIHRDTSARKSNNTTN